MDEKIPFRALSGSERSHRSRLLTEAYIPYLRERHPMGSVVAINLLTAEYVVGEHSPDAMDLYAEKFGDKANMWMEPIHWPDSRPMQERLDAVYASRWYREKCKET
jgi:hypothetical protein